MAQQRPPASCFGLSEQQLIAAFGVAGSQAAGSLQFLVNGAWNKRYQVGAAAMNGVIAATLARNDFVGATESVEGKHGLLAGYTDDAHPDKAVAELGKTYETMKIGVKPYPSCRYTHAAIDALIAMRREHNLTPDQVKRVEIGLHRNGITLTGDAATKRHPTSIVGGQFSMFFTGALARSTRARLAGTTTPALAMPPSTRSPTSSTWCRTTGSKSAAPIPLARA
ncbi:2-methylcitrate dehydratase PrpD [Bradyrhizobium sp. LB7.1]